MDPEVRISPDGLSVAIHTENADDAWNAWNVMHFRNGGHPAGEAEVKTWQTLQPDPTWTLPEAAPTGP